MELETFIAPRETLRLMLVTNDRRKLPMQLDRDQKDESQLKRPKGLY